VLPLARVERSQTVFSCDAGPLTAVLSAVTGLLSDVDAGDHLSDEKDQVLEENFLRNHQKQLNKANGVQRRSLLGGNRLHVVDPALEELIQVNRRSYDIYKRSLLLTAQEL